MNPLLTTNASAATPQLARASDTKPASEAGGSEEAEGAAFGTFFQATHEDTGKWAAAAQVSPEGIPQKPAAVSSDVDDAETDVVVETDSPDEETSAVNRDKARVAEQEQGAKNAQDLTRAEAGKTRETAIPPDPQGASGAAVDTSNEFPSKSTAENGTRTILQPDGQPREQFVNSAQSNGLQKPTAISAAGDISPAATTQTVTPPKGTDNSANGRGATMLPPAQSSDQTAPRHAGAKHIIALTPGTSAPPAQPPVAHPAPKRALEQFQEGDAPITERHAPARPEGPETRVDGVPLTKPNTPNKPTMVQTVLSASISDASGTPQEAFARIQGETTEFVQWDLRAGQPGANQMASIPGGHRADMPPHVAQQLAIAMHKAADKPVEIALNPPELGRVRMVMNASETGVVVQVLTERTDTLDLMRRNIDELGRALADLGYEDISFSFGQGDGNHTDADHDETNPDTLRLDVDDTGSLSNPLSAQLPALALAPDGIDIRL